jgi:hypothetical protein
MLIPGKMQDVVADLKVMKITQWIGKTKEREQWRLVVEEAKVPGLQRREEGRKEFQISLFSTAEKKTNISVTCFKFTSIWCLTSSSEVQVASAPSSNSSIPPIHIGIARRSVIADNTLLT